MPHLPNSFSFTSCKKYTIATLLLVITTFFLQLSVAGYPHKKKQKKTKQTGIVPSNALSFTIIPAEGNTYGYDILNHNKKMIHQPSIPGMPGNKGFTKKADAEKVAKLVMKKISNNQMPPTVSKHELDSLMVGKH